MTQAAGRRLISNYLIEIKQMETNQDAINRLDNLTGKEDPEGDHITADAVLCSVLRDLGHEDIADAFDRAKNRCGFSYA